MSPEPTPRRAPAITTLRRFLRPDHSLRARVFVEPSTEARRLARYLGFLVAPRAGRETSLSRAVGTLLVAPFTQLDLFSFDLQIFLYRVFHRRAPARVGHFLFMPVVNFFVIAALADIRLGPRPAARILFGPNLGTAYAALLLLWYLVLAHRTRLHAWGLLMIPVVAALCAGGNRFHGRAFGFNPWLGAILAAALVALSHAPEPKLPPRVSGHRHWVTIREFLTGRPGEHLSVGERVVRLLLVALQLLSGTVNELLASPRLMPYGFLLLLFAAGYRPDVDGPLRDHVRRALESGNPAIDYVGIGGGTYLDAEADRK